MKLAVTLAAPVIPPAVTNRPIGWNTNLVVDAYIKPFPVVLHSETGLSHISFPVGGHTMGAFPNAAQCLLCSHSPNSLISLYCSGDTPVTMEFPTDPG